MMSHRCFRHKTTKTSNCMQQSLAQLIPVMHQQEQHVVKQYCIKTKSLTHT